MSGRTAQLTTAFVWDCDECGRENFVRSVHIDADEETLSELREEHGIEPWETGEWCTAPTKVRCQHCGEEFEVERDTET